MKLEMARALCDDCRWPVDLIATPMRIDTAAEAIKRAYCSLCGSANVVMGGTNRELTAEEHAHKLEIMEKDNQRSRSLYP